MRLLGANALALLEEPAHQQLRGLIAPAFSGEALVAQVGTPSSLIVMGFRPRLQGSGSTGVGPPFA